jgi:glycine/D-amino acid oxidase-like deaminating enzyme
LIYDFIVIGGGIAGCAISHFLQNKKILLLEKNDLASAASGAAGAFLFPKIGFNTKYTKFVNDSLLYSFEFYESLQIDSNKSGVALLPRDENDKEKFQEYQKSFTLNHSNFEDGFFFEDGGVVEPKDVCEVLTKNIEVKRHEVKDIKKYDDIWIIDNKYQTKNIILTTGYEEIIDIEYIKIRPVWGQRIEIKTKMTPKKHYHKNCSISKNENGIVKIGATHERRKTLKNTNIEEAEFLIQKANEILPITGYEIHSMKGGLRAGSIDYFPIVGEVIDTKKTLENQPNIINGANPKEIIYKKGLYILNGGGGRGFSNYILSAKYLQEYLINNSPLPKELDTKRLFIKWARKIK